MLKRLSEEIKKLNIEFKISGGISGDRIVVFLNGHTVRYNLYHYNCVYTVTVIEDGVIVTDWDEFNNEEDFITNIINDIKEKAELYSKRNTKNILKIYNEDTIDSIIDTGFGEVCLTINVLKKYEDKSRDFVEYDGIILDAEYNDHIHDEKETEKLKSFYVGKRITTDNFGWWEIHNS
jgi:hypothetical protein